METGNPLAGMSGEQRARIIGFKEKGPWIVGKATLRYKLGMFTCEKFHFEINIPTFHHSMIPGARQTRRPRINPFILDQLQNFRDVKL